MQGEIWVRTSDTEASPVKDTNPFPTTATLPAAQIGTQGTGSSYDPPSGGSGLLGFLSGIFKEINVRLPLRLQQQNMLLTVNEQL